VIAACIVMLDMPDVCSALLAVFAFVWNSGLALVALYLGGFGTVPIYLSVLAFALVVIAYLSGKLKCPEIRCCPKSTEGKGEVRVVTMNSLRDMLADEVESPPVGAAIDVAGKDIVLTIQVRSMGPPRRHRSETDPNLPADTLGQGDHPPH